MSGGDKHIPNATIRRAWLDRTKGTRALAKEVGLSRVNLWKRAMALGLPERLGLRFKWIPDEEFTALWMAGVSRPEFVRHYGCGESSPYQSARLLGLPTKRRMPLITLAEYHEIQLRKALERDAKLVNMRFADQKVKPYADPRREPRQIPAQLG